MKSITRFLALTCLLILPGSLGPIRAQQSSRALTGEWSALQPWRNVPVHISLLPDGRLLYWGRDKRPSDNFDEAGRSNTFLFDPFYPEVNLTQLVTNTTTNLFCSGHSFLQDGKLLVSGGHKRHSDPAFPEREGIGEKHLNIFDFKTNTWTLLPTQMANGRWYPYNVMLGNGEVVIVAGSFENASGGPAVNDVPDVFTLNGSLRQTAAHGIRITPFVYPFIFSAPDGRMFQASQASDTLSRFLNVTTNQWSTGKITNGRHNVGTSVMYDQGKVLIATGHELVGPNTFVPSKFAETFNLNDSSANWEFTSDLTFGRVHATSTLLPDGKVLVTGGTQCSGTNSINCDAGAALKPELWDPATRMWTAMAEVPSRTPRVYHSVALLMPDARVLVGGGGLPAATGEIAGGLSCVGEAEKTTQCRHFGHKDVEYFSPPYLFEANGTPAQRPAIASAPSSIGYGQSFTVGVGDVPTSDIATEGVVLIRLPSVTHGFNQDQRRVKLNFSPTADGLSLNVTAPLDPKECPPGPYMLFLLRNNGRNTPSLARIIRVGGLSLHADSQAVTAGDSGVVGTATINVSAQAGLNWTAAVTSNTPWLRIRSGSSGSGNGTIVLDVDANTGTARRSGKVTVSVPGQIHTGQEFTVYQAANFSDVLPGDPLHSFIAKIYARGITAGCGSGAFCPSGVVTRQQMAAFIVGALGLTNLPEPDQSSFMDVPKSSGFFKVIEAVQRRGIMPACETGLFCPTRTVKREEMAEILLRAINLRLPPEPAQPSFQDVTQANNPQYYRWIEELKRRQITAGCGGGLFCPKGEITRGQMAVFLVATFGL